MVGDVHRFCRSCLTCAAYRGAGRKFKPLLRPIPVERVGVDILEMPRTLQGNRYIVVFMEYLMKWVEAYAVEDQTSETIARLLIDNVVCRHGVPTQLSGSLIMLSFLPFLGFPDVLSGIVPSL